MIVVLAPAAEADMGEILDYIALDNPDRAESFVDEIIDGCLEIPAFPEAGTARPDVADGARSIVHGSRSLPDSL
ncbi:MAG: plasmid stabilization protein [Maricaulis sp.]|nr:plasmid stabilization protein [Maricaulis sp.]